MSRKGLHLTESRSRRLAINFLERIGKFEKMKDAIIVEEDELAICREKFNLSNNNVQTDKVKANVQMST